MSQQERLGNDEFLGRLTTLFTSTHSSSHGSIYLTQKPLPATSTPDSSTPTPSSQLLIRATNGLSKPHRIPSKPASKQASKTKSQAAADSQRPKVRIATVVDLQDVDSFYAKYAEVCKKGMEGLRKRDKKKAKEKAKAKKKGKTGTAGAPAPVANTGVKPLA